MSSNNKENIEEAQQKSTTAAPDVQAQQSTSSKKKKKEKSNEMNAQLLEQLIKSKVQDLSSAPQKSSNISQDTEYINLKTGFNEINQIAESINNSTVLSQEEQRVTLNKILENIMEYGIQLEQRFSILKLLQKDVRNQRETFSMENKNSVAIQVKMESTCREIEQKIAEAKEINKRTGEEEDKQCEDLSENFEKSIQDIEEKISKQNQADQQMLAENEQMKIELEEKMKIYESKESEFKNVLSEKDTNIKGKGEEMLKQIEEIKDDARKTIESQTELQKLNQSETEQKCKIFLYKEKYHDFINHMDKTHQMLIQFREEMIKVANRLQVSSQTNQKLKAQQSVADQALIQINEENIKIKQEVENVKQNKQAYKTKILELQKQIKEKQDASQTD